METVTNVNEQKSLFSFYLDALDSREKKIETERQLQEEKYLRRTQRIHEFHERQCREVVELRRCLQYVSEHAHVLECVLRGGGGGEGATGAPLSAALLRQAAALRASMLQCVSNATRIKERVADKHHPHIDTLLAKMEAELRHWTEFVAGASHALHNTTALMDNIHNLIEMQRRCVSEVSSSGVFASVCAGPGAGEREGPEAGVEGAEGGEGGSPNQVREPAACSTPIPRE